MFMPRILVYRQGKNVRVRPLDPANDHDDCYHELGKENEKPPYWMGLETVKRTARRLTTID
jgi:hypothetical protein